MVKARNPLACLPILRKGGVHERSKSGKRAIDKRSLETEIDEYFDSQLTTQAKPRLAGSSGETDSIILSN